MQAQPGQFAFDLANRLLALVESLPLGLREGEFLDGLALALLGFRDGARELVGAIGPCRPATSRRNRSSSFSRAATRWACSRSVRFISSTSASACS